MENSNVPVVETSLYNHLKKLKEDHLLAENMRLEKQILSSKNRPKSAKRTHFRKTSTIMYQGKNCKGHLFLAPNIQVESIKSSVKSPKSPKSKELRTISATKPTEGTLLDPMTVGELTTMPTRKSSVKSPSNKPSRVTSPKQSRFANSASKTKPQTTQPDKLRRIRPKTASKPASKKPSKARKVEPKLASAGLAYIDNSVPVDPLIYGDSILTDDKTHEEHSLDQFDSVEFAVVQTTGQSQSQL